MERRFKPYRGLLRQGTQDSGFRGPQTDEGFLDPKLIQGLGVWIGFSKDVRHPGPEHGEEVLYLTGQIAQM